MNPHSKVDEKTSTLIKIHHFKKFREEVKRAKHQEGTSNDALKEKITLLLSSKDFKELKQDIEDARQQAKEKPYASLDEDTKMLLEIPAFYDGVELHLYPWEHSDLFPTPIAYHGHIDTVYSVTRSKKMEEADLSILLSKPYAFDKKSLIKYLEDLKGVFESTNNNTPIILSSTNHAVCLRYNVQNKLWEYVDTNDFHRYADKSYSRELDCSALANSIFRSFLCEKHTHTVFNTMVIATPPQQNAPQIESNKFEALKTKLAEFDKNHPITSEQVKMYDAKQVGLFFLACNYGHLGVVNQLINDKNIKDSINKKTNEGTTAFLVACLNGHSDVVLKLLECKDILVNQPRNDGTTPFYIACSKGYLSIVDKFLEREDIHTLINQSIKDGFTPLHAACYAGHLDIIDKFLERKDADTLINQPTGEGATLLFIACQKGYFHIVEKLLTLEGILVNEATKAGTTPLAIAKHFNHSKIVELLEGYIKSARQTKQTIVPSEKKEPNTEFKIVPQNLSPRREVLDMRREQQQRYKSEISLMRASLSAERRGQQSVLEDTSSGIEEVDADTTTMKL